jgi:hypothetical protein
MRVVGEVVLLVVRHDRASGGADHARQRRRRAAEAEDRRAEVSPLPRGAGARRGPLEVARQRLHRDGHGCRQRRRLRWDDGREREVVVDAKRGRAAAGVDDAALTGVRTPRRPHAELRVVIVIARLRLAGRAGAGGVPVAHGLERASGACRRVGGTLAAGRPSAAARLQVAATRLRDRPLASLAARPLLALAPRRARRLAEVDLGAALRRLALLAGRGGGDGEAEEETEEDGQGSHRGGSYRTRARER